MKLPVREFADVIAALKSPAENLSFRKTPARRMAINAKVNVHLLDNNRLVKSFSALVRATFL